MATFALKIRFRMIQTEIQHLSVIDLYTPSTYVQWFSFYKLIILTLYDTIKHFAFKSFSQIV